MNSELIISFKDFLMGLPTGLRFKILIDNSELTTGTIDKAHETLQFSFKTLDNRTLNAYVGEAHTPIKTVSMKASYEINLLLLNPAGYVEKSIGKARMNTGKRLTIVAVSPWVKVPLSGGNISGSFWEVEYNIKHDGDRVETVKVAVYDLPKKILSTALKYRHSKSWAYNVSKTSVHPHNGSYTIPANAWKCSQFVNDVLTEVGIPPPWMERGKGRYIPFYQEKYSPPVAAEWANSQLMVRWSTTSSPKPGDIASYKANYSDASGHVGFFLSQGVSISAGQDKIEVNDAGFRNGENKFDVFRRYKPKE